MSALGADSRPGFADEDGREWKGSWKSAMRATGRCGRRAGSCRQIGSHTGSGYGTVGRKPAPTATHAAGSWNSFAHRRTGERAPIRSPNVRGCLPTGSRDAGSTSRKMRPAAITYARHAAISYGDSRRSCVRRRLPTSSKKCGGRTARYPTKSHLYPPQSIFVNPHSSSSFVGCSGTPMRISAARPSMRWRHGPGRTPGGIGILLAATGPGLWERTRLQSACPRTCVNWKTASGAVLTPQSTGP